MEVLKAKSYSNAYLYGDTELDGLHVMYVIDDHLAIYGLQVNPKVSTATVAWQDVIQPIGWAVGGVTILGLGLNYIVARANAKKEEK